MVAAQVADIAVGNIDDWRGDPLAVPLSNLQDFVKNQGLFVLKFLPLGLFDLIERHLYPLVCKIGRCVNVFLGTEPYKKNLPGSTTKARWQPKEWRARRQIPPRWRAFQRQGGYRELGSSR